MSGFEIVYDQYFDGFTTDIMNASKPRVMTITTSKGTILISAVEDVNVTIMSSNGMKVGSFQMNAGEQKLVSLPSGVYVVNNTKIIVK